MCTGSQHRDELSSGSKSSSDCSHMETFIKIGFCPFISCQKIKVWLYDETSPRTLCSMCSLDVGSRQTTRRKNHSVITVCFPVCVGCIPGSVFGGGASIISPAPHSISRTVYKPALPSSPPQFVLLPLAFHRIHLLLCSLFGAASVCFLLYSLPNDQLDYLPALLPVISCPQGNRTSTSQRVISPHTTLSWTPPSDQDCLNLPSFRSVALFVPPRD